MHDNSTDLRPPCNRRVDWNLWEAIEFLLNYRYEKKYSPFLSISSHLILFFLCMLHLKAKTTVNRSAKPFMQGAVYNALNKGNVFIYSPIMLKHFVHA